MKMDFGTKCVIILAAGESKRMGTPKGLLDYDGKPFLQNQIEKLQDIGLSNIVIVLGKDKEVYFEQVPLLKDFIVVTNPSPEKGIFSSIQCGLSAISKLNFEGIFILPVDVPCPSKEVWILLLVGMLEAEVIVTVPKFMEKKGHPVLISNQFAEYLLTCKTDSRLDYEIREQINKRKGKIISVKDSTILLNLNTIGEWETFKVR
ncbi:MAG: nucleotidyltransferase family protein [Candidatus Heimdallarchaeaceae archaeon]